MKFRAFLLSIIVVGSHSQLTAQQPTSRAASSGSSQQVLANPTPGSLIGQENAITTAVPFLAITPDARHAGLGDAGVATSPDASAAYWNAGKLAFIDKQYGISFGYTPWLGKIVNDMSITAISGFYKINRQQAVAFDFKYFDLGDISFRDDNNNPLGDFNPREVAIGLSYSRLLTENFSVGISGRYIRSNLTGAFTGNDAQPGSSVAADIGLFYTKQLESVKNSTLSFGASISNIGAKISYTGGENKDFLPTNLRIGTAYTRELDPFNSFTFILDFNKLMVPTPPIRDPDTGEIIKGKNPNRPLLSGMFGSFSDAPGGFKEEMKEIMMSFGVEYWYNKTFSGRVGYFNENKLKGNRKYATLGLGFRSQKSFGIDVAYLVPTNKREHPLAETIRFTIMFLIEDHSNRGDAQQTNESE